MHGKETKIFDRGTHKLTATNCEPYQKTCAKPQAEMRCHVDSNGSSRTVHFYDKKRKLLSVRFVRLARALPESDTDLSQHYDIPLPSLDRWSLHGRDDGYRTRFGGTRRSTQLEGVIHEDMLHSATLPDTYKCLRQKYTIIMALLVNSP